MKSPQQSVYDHGFAVVVAEKHATGGVTGVCDGVGVKDGVGVVVGVSDGVIEAVGVGVSEVVGVGVGVSVGVGVGVGVSVVVGVGVGQTIHAAHEAAGPAKLTIVAPYKGPDPSLITTVAQPVKSTDIDIE
jgi:hypothetical protein